MAILVLLGSMLGLGASHAEEGPHPGFPAYPPADPDWTAGAPFAGVLQNGSSVVTKQRQGVRTGAVIAANIIQYSLHGVVGNSDCDASLPEVISCFASRNNLQLVSPPGSEHNYGLTPVFTTRTVAFGTIPVEVDAQLETRRDSAGLPEYLSVVTPDKYVNPGPHTSRERYMYDTDAEFRLYLNINELRVDGRRIRFDNTCRTAAPNRLTLHGEGFWAGDPAVDMSRPLWESGVFAAGSGGLLTGNMEIGRFGPCVTTDGDDLSPLLTAAISGPENPVTLNVTGPTCGQLGSPYPPGTTVDDWEAEGCLIPPDPDFPGAE